MFFAKTFLPYYFEATRNLEENTHLIQLTSMKLPTRFELRLTTPLKKQAQLRNARQILESSSEPDDEANFMVRKLCESVEGCELSFSEDKAWALYYLGHLELQEARCTGALQELWSENGERYFEIPMRSLHEARRHLSRAILWTMNVSDVLFKNILRSLALAVGPAESNGVGISVGTLILASIGQSIRRRMVYSLRQNSDAEIDTSRVQSVFGTFDGPWGPDIDRDHRISMFLRDLAHVTPQNWRFTAAAICPSGEILVTSLQKVLPNAGFEISTKCVFPPQRSNAYDIVMKPFDNIMLNVQEQLQGIDAVGPNDKESTKRKWWRDRGSLDEELGDLLVKVDDTLFANVLAPSDVNAAMADSSDHSTSSSSNDNREFPRGNLASRFEAAFDTIVDDSNMEQNNRVTRFKELTVEKLKDRLRDLSVADSTLRKLRKKDLFELLLKLEEKHRRDGLTTAESTREQYCSAESCLFLLLDENLQRFPFEGLPSLLGKTVCRVPCLSFILATLCEHITDTSRTPSVDPDRASYVLDPENNLRATRARLLPVIESLGAKKNWDWNGVVGEIPTPSFFSKALAKHNGLVMYFGHGGAQLCWSRRDVEEMIKRRVSNSLDDGSEEPTCRATVVLMGCSSGKLVSVNKKNSAAVEQVPLYYEPEGIALSYLCAGAPCVLGNLWDVTDHDIDRCVLVLLSQLDCRNLFVMFQMR
jgi:Peptidase family C50